MNILYLDSVISFGRHKGKSLKDVVFGIELTDSDLEKLFDTYCDEIIDWETERKKLNNIGDIEWLGDAYSIMMKKFPDPGWLIWAILNTKDIVIDNDSLKIISTSKVEYLHKFEWKLMANGHYYAEPIYRLEDSGFTEYIVQCNEGKLPKKSDGYYSDPDLDENLDNDDDDGYDTSDFDNICPACENEIPCGCQHSYRHI